MEHTDEHVPQIRGIEKNSEKEVDVVGERRGNWRALFRFSLVFLASGERLLTVPLATFPTHLAREQEEEIWLRGAKTEQSSLVKLPRCSLGRSFPRVESSSTRQGESELGTKSAAVSPFLAKKQQRSRSSLSSRPNQLFLCQQLRPCRRVEEGGTRRTRPDSR